MRHFTEEERIRRVWDKEEAKAVLCRNMYYMAANQRQTALDTLWVKEPEHAKTASYGKNWGYYIGMDEIRRYYVDNNPFGARGTMNCHPVATIRVEEAEDGETILCQWYNASYETRMVNGVLTPLWVCEKGNADLVREADGWKIWHLQYLNDVDCICGQSWAGAQVPYPDLPEFAPLADFHYPEYSVCTQFRPLYSADRPTTPCPEIPQPYATFAETFSYGV